MSEKHPLKVPCTIAGTTLPFFCYTQEGITYYEFDARDATPPEPLVNAMHALRLIESEKERLVGYFFHEPQPLYIKIQNYFSYEAEPLADGSYKITFKKS